MYSTYSFAQPSFISGLARTFDLGAVFDDHNGVLTPELADRLALYSDWLAVDEDLRSAIAEYAALSNEAAGIRSAYTDHKEEPLPA